MRATEGALTGLSAFVHVQGTPAAASLFSCHLPLDGCLFPPPVDGHNQKSKREREKERPLVSPWRGPYSESCSLPFLTDGASKLEEIGRLPIPSPGQLLQWQPPWLRATPRHPILCSANQVKTGGLSFN